MLHLLIGLCQVLNSVIKIKNLPPLVITEVECIKPPIVDELGVTFELHHFVAQLLILGADLMQLTLCKIEILCYILLFQRCRFLHLVEILNILFEVFEKSNVIGIDETIVQRFLVFKSFKRFRPEVEALGGSKFDLVHSGCLQVLVHFPKFQLDHYCIFPFVFLFGSVELFL